MKRFLSVLLLLSSAIPVCGQTHYAATGTVQRRAVYVLGTAARPNMNTDWLLGGTIGGYNQWTRFIGVDARFTKLAWGPSYNHEYFLVAGPRVTYSRRKFTAFGNFDVGLGHVQYQTSLFPNGTIYPAGSSTRLSYVLSGGADYHLNNHLMVRLGQFDYAYINALDSGINPKMLSSGIVFNLF